MACNSLKAREKSRVQGAIGFGLASHWLKNWRAVFFSRTLSVAIAIVYLLLIVIWKPLYYACTHKVICVDRWIGFCDWFPSTTSHTAVNRLKQDDYEDMWCLPKMKVRTEKDKNSLYCAISLSSLKLQLINTDKRLIAICFVTFQHSMD